MDRPAPSPAPGHESDWVGAQTTAEPGPQQGPGVVDPVAAVAVVAGRWDGVVALTAYYPHGWHERALWDVLCTSAADAG